MTTRLDLPARSYTFDRPDGIVGDPQRNHLRARDLLTLIFSIATAVALWPLVLALRSGKPLQLPVLTAHVAGMLAGYGVIVLIGLMSRTPALERDIGSDRLARWHSRGGRIVIGLVLVHAWAAVVAWSDARNESTAHALWDVLRMPGLIAATLGTAMLLVVAAVSIRAARRHLGYERWQAVHLIVYIAVALSFSHQLAGPDLAGYRWLQVAWALLYTLVFGLVLKHRVIAPIRAANRHRMRVREVIHEGPDTFSLVIEGRHLDELDARAGQFFRWRFLSPDTWRAAHPFSLSAQPTDTSLRLTVKSLGEGSRRVQQVEPGTWVVAEGPYGAMTSDRRTGRSVLLIAGGVGITPMRALFESIEPSRGQDVLLLYRARSSADLLFLHELNELAERPRAAVRYLTGDEFGRFTAASLTELVPDLVERDVYLCGPPRLATAVRRAVRSAGLPEDRFHEERFDF